MSNGSMSVPRNDDGEFELILGNKQLISVFVIVVVLLGVFFAMGYIVGRSSTPMDTAARKPESEYVRTDAPSAMGARTLKHEAEAPSSETPAASATATTTLAARLSEPASGQTFLQVASVAKPQADVLEQVLKKKGFQAIIAPGPNEDVFRVLVGPAHETAEIAKLKADLEQAGFKPFLKKY